MTKRLAFVFPFLALLGCAAQPPPALAFDYAPPDRAQWTRTYAADRVKGPLQGELKNDRIDAVVKVYRDPFHSPTAADAARAYRSVMRHRGFDLGEYRLDVAEDGRASFPLTDAAHRLRGEVIAMRVPGDASPPRYVVLVGTWPEENDGQARRGMRLLAANLFVHAER